MTADTNRPGSAPWGRMRPSVRQGAPAGPLAALAGLLALAFVVFGFRLLNPAYPGGDLLYHGALALDLLRDGLPMEGAYAGLPAYYPPGYHVLLATLVGTLGVAPVDAAGILFLALLPVLGIGTYLLADRLTGRPWVAVLAVAITLFGGAYDLNPVRQWVNSMFMGGQAAWTSYPRDLVFAILPFAAYAFVRALEPGAHGRRWVAWAGVAGLLLGGAALVQVQLLLPIPFALAATAIVVAVRDPSRRGRAVAALAICGLVAAVMAAPWLLGTLDDVRRSGGVALDSSDQLEPARYGFWNYPREFGLLLPLGLLGAGAMLLFLRRPDGPRPTGEPGPWTPALREGGVLLVDVVGPALRAGRPLRPVVAPRGCAPAAAPLAHRLAAPGDPRRGRPGDRGRARAARPAPALGGPDGRGGDARGGGPGHVRHRLARGPDVDPRRLRDARPRAGPGPALRRGPRSRRAPRDAPRTRGLVGAGVVRDRPAGRGAGPAGLREARLRPGAVHDRLPGGAAGGARGGLVR